MRIPKPRAAGHHDADQRRVGHSGRLHWLPLDAASHRFGVGAKSRRRDAKDALHERRLRNPCEATCSDVLQPSPSAPSGSSSAGAVQLSFLPRIRRSASASSACRLYRFDRPDDGLRGGPSLSGHFKPAVTLGLWSAGRGANEHVLRHSVVQVVGAIAAAAALWFIASGKPDGPLAGSPATATGYSAPATTRRQPAS